MKKLRNLLKKFIVAMIIVNNMYIVPIYASAETVTNPINKLAGLMTSIIAAVGAIILAKNIFDFASAYQNQDSAGTSMALKGIVAGLLMISIKVVIEIMGV